MKTRNTFINVSLICLLIVVSFLGSNIFCYAEEWDKITSKPIKEKTVYVFYPKKSMHIEKDIYYSEEQINQINENYRSVEAYLAFKYNPHGDLASQAKVEYKGEATIKKQKVYHYFIDGIIVDKNEGVENNGIVGYTDIVIKTSKTKTIFRPYYFENFMEEFGKDDRKEYKELGTYKCNKAFYIRYPYPVKKANGKIQKDGYTVKYTCLIGKNKMELHDDKIWATFKTSQKE